MRRGAHTPDYVADVVRDEERAPLIDGDPDRAAQRPVAGIEKAAEDFDGGSRGFAIRERNEQTLRLLRPQASDEELCDSTGGKWTDDDPDPATGLYCICRAGTGFIPSSGGCVP